MNNDLISREALKKAIDDYAEKRQDTLLWQADVEEIIDNAPTVNKFYDYNEGYKDGFSLGFKRGTELNEERPQGEWIDYDNTFYKCPECGYLLEKCCPQCQTKVILPKGGAE